MLGLWPVVAFVRAPADTIEFAWMVEANRLGTYAASSVFLWVIFLFVIVVQRLTKSPYSEIGLRFPRWRDVGAGLAFMLAASPALGVLAWTLQNFGLTIPEIVIRALVPTNMTEWCAWIGLSLTAAISEETIFRGYLLAHGESVLRNKTLAVAIAALAFGIGHVYQGAAGVILITVYALLLTWLRVRTNGLWAPVIAHTLQNVSAAYLASLQSR